MDILPIFATYLQRDLKSIKVRLINTNNYLYILKTINMPANKFILPKTCEICGSQFNAKTIYSKYCSKKCTAAASRKKIAQEKQEEQRTQLAAQIPDDRPYISIAEAVLLFGISRDTIYRQIRKGNIPAVNLGERLTRISKIHIEAMFSKFETVSLIPVNKKLNYDKEECYTIGEISKKFEVSDSTVNKTIRKNSIPKKQIGKFVYVPKVEIDRIFSSNK
jgi:excisionase family DNA binding protein